MLQGVRPDAMTPAYGLAEATVVVSLSPRGTRALTHRLDRQALLRDGLVRDAAEGVEAIEYADVGLPLASTQVRVVGEDGSVIVDDHMETSVSGLFGAGDVVLGLDQISHAMGMAGVAATTIRNKLAEDRSIRR